MRTSAIACASLLLAGSAVGEGPSHRTCPQQTKVVAADGYSGDFFGHAVTLNGDTAIIGAYGDDGTIPTVKVKNWYAQGSAYVFERDPLDPTRWIQYAKLLDPEIDHYARFGYSVSLSGSTVVIGAYVDSSGNGSGSAYFFERDPSDPVRWTETAKVKSHDGDTADYFGWAVALSGDTAVIGAYHDDDHGSSSGSAYLFERGGAGHPWEEVMKLVPEDGAENDFFGYSLSISGDTVVIGAQGDDDLGSASGSAYVYQHVPSDATTAPGSWVPGAKLTAPDGEAYEYFGRSVSISMDTILVGARWDDDSGVGAGSAYVFARDPLDPLLWHLTAKLTASDAAPYDHFGQGVAISGDLAVVSALGDDDRGLDSGSAYVFERDPSDGTQWHEVAKLLASDGAPDDYFGERVAVSGRTALVGARFHDGDAGEDQGAAYLYSLEESSDEPGTCLGRGW